MQVSFHTAEQLSLAVEQGLRDISVLLYHRLDSVAPYPGFQSHNGIEMYYIESGRGVYLVGDQAYTLQPGTLMIIPPFTLHKVLQTDPETNLCRSVLMCTEQFLEAEWPDHYPFPLTEMTSSCSRIQFGQELHDRISGIYRHLNQELAYRVPSSLSIISCLIKELLLLAHRSMKNGEPQPPEPPSEQLPQEISFLVQYIGNHFQSELQLERLSRLVHMNSSYLSTLFHKHVGIPLNRFITIKRIHYAKSLLRETALSVTDIAFQCGFNHPTYFIKIFKKLEQVSPAAYRKEHLLRS
ncbi:AraC-type DNA-binding protein [Paenibacillus sp. UNCCL117]|uniref:AraC family transcriptional regulator n=1 Tax=unclassified Paenibacillus TaxID=185978 RepID=UPI000880696C|nr:MULTISPECIES: helix-turn-helix domain-containing protein [unclassified Paenibacillus]SDE26858.1 AraC-type DNA-binding protein [Paenibacillus sp. cl123]SFW62712.1 AraC-type DNA-binding protein [Paenibacillus sp. UNCCL117]